MRIECFVSLSAIFMIINCIKQYVRKYNEKIPAKNSDEK